jgi:hypothetical protein
MQKVQDEWFPMELSQLLLAKTDIGASCKDF